ncbi:hypothetical protein MKX73_16850 [Solibacillus sp. FSL W7-1436]|uniref:hypothetical protein n=1 Tax=Solibacillus sp. FSL W7-1436 TaxID=2921705 RepID=UPI0030FD0F07
MDVKQLNEQLYKNRPPVGSTSHCDCQECVFYAVKIMLNEFVVNFLYERGLHPLKADEVWCYKEDDGFKYYCVDFFEVFAMKEQSLIFDVGKLIIASNPFAENEHYRHALTIDIRLQKIGS